MLVPSRPALTQPSNATKYMSGLDHTRGVLLPRTIYHVPRIMNLFVCLLNNIYEADLSILQVNDYWYAVVFVVQPTTVVLSSPRTSSARGDTDYRSAIILDVQPGVTKLRCPLVVDGTMRVQLQRGDSTVLDYVADGFVFNGSPPTYNFNAWVGWKASS